MKSYIVYVLTDKPKTSHALGGSPYCNERYKRTGQNCLSIYLYGKHIHAGFLEMQQQKTICDGSQKASNVMKKG